MDVSVLVPVLNEASHIRHTVENMRAQRFDGTYELLFMDGRSEDDTRAILEGLSADDPRIRVLDNPSRNTPAGLNVGLGAARGEFVARMDAHTFYPPEYLAKGVERLRLGDVDWVSGPQIPQGAGRWSRRVAMALTTWLGQGSSSKWGVDGGSPTQEIETREIELDTGVFAGVWRRESLEAHRGWDEGWPINQDSELAARYLQAGARIVSLPELGARYVPRDSVRSLARQYWRYGQYRAKTSGRHPESMRPSLALNPGLALTLVMAVAAPRPVRLLARAGLAAYALIVGVTSARAARVGDPRDAAALPLIFAVMHFAWGFGFLAGCARFGVPTEAFARIVRITVGAGRQAVGRRTGLGAEPPGTPEPARPAGWSAASTSD